MYILLSKLTIKYDIDYCRLDFVLICFILTYFHTFYACKGALFYNKNAFIYSSLRLPIVGELIGSVAPHSNANHRLSQ